MSVTPYLWVMHQPLCAVAYSHSCAFFAGLVLRAWRFDHHTCGNTGVTYWLKAGTYTRPLFGST